MASLQPIEQRAQAFIEHERPSGLMLDPDPVTAQAVAAARFYGGFARLDEPWARLAVDPDAPDLATIDATTPLSDSEWALVRPLFLLYLERETALMLEASRGLGVDVFGRSTSEIATDITLVEQEMAHRAFLFPVLTII